MIDTFREPLINEIVTCHLFLPVSSSYKVSRVFDNNLAWLAIPRRVHKDMRLENTRERYHRADDIARSLTRLSDKQWDSRALCETFFFNWTLRMAFFLKRCRHSGTYFEITDLCLYKLWHLNCKEYGVFQYLCYYTSLFMFMVCIWFSFSFSFHYCRYKLIPFSLNYLL